ncbi:MAG TPA: polysaccharide biosynthesis/export family protein [Pyrinomonadaceae bacterium]|jgi:protein involved in polysaccharide export with SLBB domain|nr:polysaccharide biosynthesis/export family protein [Pyrinomonadaceae bacterium]
MKRIFISVAAIVAAAGAVCQDVLLRSGDQIELRLGGVPSEEMEQVSGRYQVDGQGFLNLPHIGKIRAAGLAQAEVQNAIETVYRGQQIYTNPTITINVPNQARFVNVGGDVKTPRRVEFTTDLTVLGAINAAGGCTEFADQTKVRLLRDGNVTIVNIKEVRKDPARDSRLKPGDTVEVPQSFW